MIDQRELLLSGQLGRALQDDAQLLLEGMPVQLGFETSKGDDLLVEIAHDHLGHLAHARL